MSNSNRKDTDFLDSLFEKHLKDDQFINSSIQDFGQMIKEAINEEARKSGYDSLSEMIQEEIKEGLNGKDYQSYTEKSVQQTDLTSRYEYFIDSIAVPAYLQRHDEQYKNGYLTALNRYRQQAELNRNNLCALEKIIQEEIHSGSQLKQDSYSGGYIDGLRFIQRNLLQSKAVMMDKVNEALQKAMNRK